MCCVSGLSVRLLGFVKEKLYVGSLCISLLHLCLCM